MSEKQKNTNNRTRNFTCIVYEDSAPENWREIISSHCIPCYISPLHDKDINANGTGYKKAHYHIVVMFGSLKSVEQAHEFFDSFKGVYPPENPPLDTCKVKDLRGMARYLCHMDNPDKARYCELDVVSLCGAPDYFTCISSSVDVLEILIDIENFCERYDVVSFYALSRYASLHRKEWCSVVKTKCSIYLREYLNSRKWSKENGVATIVDPDTGEVLV